MMYKCPFMGMTYPYKGIRASCERSLTKIDYTTILPQFNCLRFDFQFEKSNDLFPFLYNLNKKII
jgi:hypothetical protein